MCSAVRRGALQRIYAVYQGWLDDEKFACVKGCSACCTQNVMVTRFEAELVLSEGRRLALQEWLAAQLQCPGNTVCRLTMNEWAGQCITGHPSPEDHIDQDDLTSCPFIADDYSCMIYEARPFACRCFSSLSPCLETGAASQPKKLTAVNTAVMQIIEHLGQGELYGPLVKMVYVLGSREENRDIAGFPAAGASGEESGGLEGLRLARPLPGFVTEEEDRGAVRDFLNTLLQERIQDRSLQDILNNG